MKLDGWLALMEDAKIQDAHVTMFDVQMAYLWSRMVTVDVLKDYDKYGARNLATGSCLATACWLLVALVTATWLLVTAG